MAVDIAMPGRTYKRVIVDRLTPGVAVLGTGSSRIGSIEMRTAGPPPNDGLRWPGPGEPSGPGAADPGFPARELGVCARRRNAARAAISTPANRSRRSGSALQKCRPEATTAPRVHAMASSVAVELLATDALLDQACRPRLQRCTNLG